jgi:hypothetical protein
LSQTFGIGNGWHYDIPEIIVISYCVIHLLYLGIPKVSQMEAHPEESSPRAPIFTTLTLTLGTAYVDA